ncbi:AraC family transcriptional regulator [Bdellovibrio sp. SKB1291214]|uniref:AraC family transcriptional regulator n=1 Tax=Bdellovibrio sp. SKB1291214 TaxID=1732569 RepID=UPI00223E8FB2|nr:AraC family transcriptional regulator [Bdellovibrio sp. SKB1291214]UYL09116.1 AraC family transcriptional regulator [Bdellovibrio sp. SKB1291214]
MSAKSELKRRHPLESLGVKMVRRGDIRIERLQDRLNPKVPFPHKHDFYQIVILHSAMGWHEIDFKKYPVKGSQVFLIKPGQMHEWKLPVRSKGFVIEYTEESFSKDFLGKLKLAQHSRQVPDHFRIPRGNNVFSDRFLTMMEQEFLNPGDNFELCLQNYLCLVLLEALRLSKAADRQLAENDDVITRFTDMVEEHFQEHHQVEFYAGELGLTAKALSAKIQKNLRLSAKEYILNRCLLEAKRLLSYSDLSISEIGYSLGFDDPNYFSRFLKKNMKMSAGKFRKTPLKD